MMLGSEADSMTALTHCNDCSLWITDNSTDASSTMPSLANGTTNTSDASDAMAGWFPAYWSSYIAYPEAQQTTQAGVWLRLTVLPFVLLAGFLGNGMTIALMRRPSMRRSSYSPYLTALAASDSMALVVRLAFWINLVALTLDNPVLITFRSRGACALVEYVGTANHVLCSWLVVVLTYERLVVVAFPLKSARYVNASNSVKLVVILVTSCLLLTAYVPAIVRWVPAAGGCVIGFPRDLIGHFGLATTFVSILPLFLICCGNLIIVVVLYLQSRSRAKLMAGSVPAATKANDRRPVSVSGDERGSAAERKDDMKTGGGDPENVSNVQTPVDVVPQTVGYQDDVSLLPTSTTETSEQNLSNSSRKQVVNEKTPNGGHSSQGEPKLSSTSKPSPSPSTEHNLARTSAIQTSEPSSKKSQSKENSTITTMTTTTTTTTTKKPVSNSSSNDQQMRRVTSTLLCVSLAFLVLVMPNAVLVLALALRPDWSSLQPLLDPLALLWDGNFAINFYLYVFAGANFRAEVIKMLGCGRAG